MGQIDPDDATGAVWLGLRKETDTVKKFSAAASITHDADGMPKIVRLSVKRGLRLQALPVARRIFGAGGGRGTSEMEDAWLGGGLYVTHGDQRAAGRRVWLRLRRD